MQGTLWLVRASGVWLTQRGVAMGVQVALVGLAGPVGIAGAVFAGVYLEAWMGIGGPMADFFNALRPGLVYLVIFAVYGALFLLSTASLARVRQSG